MYTAQIVYGINSLIYISYFLRARNRPFSAMNMLKSNKVSSIYITTVSKLPRKTDVL